MSTPIEVLFHHNPNCSCDQCQKTVKPYRNGKFFSKEEIDQINNDLQALVKENEKLHKMLEKLTEEKIESKKLIEALQAKPEEKEEEAVEEVKSTAKPSRNLTITVDTSNLFYIVVIAVLLIMIIKK